MYRKLLSLFTSLILVASAIPLFGSMVRGATASDLYETAIKNGQDSFSVTLECNGRALTDGSDIQYGDTIVCSLSWKFPDKPILELTPGDSLTYDLPVNMNFETKSDTIYDKTKPVGTFTISGHTITITYTDPDFCAQNDRVGNLSFYGSIEADPNPNQDPDPIVISFKGKADLTLNVSHAPVTAKLEVDKIFHPLDPVNHIYSCLIPITATGNQNNLVVTDTMWPGMEIYGDAPKVYADSTLRTPYTNCTEFKDDGGSDHRTFTGKINSLRDGQTVYLYYEVKVRDEMYDNQQAQAWIDSQSAEWQSYYPNGYEGTISNRVSVKSDQYPNGATKLSEIYGAGYQLKKWRAAPLVDQATGVDELELGYIRWQLFINPIFKSTITQGYIMDTLPANSSFDESSISFHDPYWNELNFSDYVTYTVDKTAGTVRFDFKPELIAELKTRTEGLYIEYRTHVDKQTAQQFEYKNTATLYYNGEAPEKREDALTLDRPSELQKYVLYDAGRAPYAQYTIVVNPMAMDLDPNSDDLILSDTMGEALDLVVDSITIDGQAASSGDVSFDPASRTFTLKLKDATRYIIKYNARVNLAPNEDPDTLNAANSTNTCELVGVITNGTDNSAELHSKVYNMAASSSSQVGYASFSVIKHDEASTTKFLSGATFEVSSATVKDGKVTGTTSIDSQTTGTNGKVTFESLTRGTFYRFTETSAPDGYELDDTPFFVVFAETSTSTYPSTVTYGEKDYPVMVIDFNRSSYDQYVSNAPENTTPTPPASGNVTTPSSSTSETTVGTSATTPSSSETVPTSTESNGTTATPSETTMAPSESTQAPSETTSDVQGDERDRLKEDGTSETTSAVKASGRIIKTGEAISILAIIGAGMTILSFAVILYLQKKDHAEEK